tara:strand:- start:126 stop:1283 length:1158 start_codon:yes stop_codon:yes gene_type:complete
MVIDVILTLIFLFVVLGIGRAVWVLRIHTFVYYFFRILFFKKPGILTQKPYPELHSYEKGFAEYYDKKLKHLAEKAEYLRIDTLTRSKRALISILPFIILTLIILILVGFAGLGEGFVVIALFVVFVGGVIFAIIFDLLVGKGKGIYTFNFDRKEQIIPIILDFYGGFKYTPLDRLHPYNIDVEPYFKYSIIPEDFNSIMSSTEDQISGTYKNVRINCFEAKLDGDPQIIKGYKTLRFKGLILDLSVNKNFTGKTIIKTDKGSLINNISERKLPENQEVVRLEDPEFEKLFEVYSDDQVQARYLLTTSFMERLIELQQAFGSQKIECCFYEKTLLIKIPTNYPWFEIHSIFEQIDLQESSKKILANMNSILNICETLQMDSDIGL